MRYVIIFALLLSVLVIGCSAPEPDASSVDENLSVVVEEDAGVEGVTDQSGSDLGNETSVDDVDDALSDVDLEGW